MSSRILHELATDKRYRDVPLPVLEEVYPRELICEILSETGHWEQRERKLSHVFLIYLLIAWTILPLCALKQVCSLLTSGLRWLCEPGSGPLPTASALCYRRFTLGVTPLRLLLRLACQPLCQPETPGAFLFGRRLIAIDSKLFDVCDTPENDWVFRGRDRDDQARSRSPFPQLRVLSALEIGSHAHVGAVLAPGYHNELSLVNELLTFLPSGSLVLQDSGFRAGWWLAQLVQHGHDTITRLAATEYPCDGERLPDGSYLVQVKRSANAPLPQPLLLRIIEYRLAPPIATALAALQKSRSRSGSRRRPDADEQVYRLATTLLDPVRFPAQQIAACYHERWEVELVYDELQEHQMSTPRLLSKTSTTVLQEGYAMILGHYAVRAWMIQSARQAEPLDVDRLSFTQALAVLGTALTLSQPLAQAASTWWKGRLLDELRQPDRLLPPLRRLRCYPRVVKVASTRFFLKQAKDLPFVLADKTTTWSDVILLLPAPQDAGVLLLI